MAVTHGDQVLLAMIVSAAIIALVYEWQFYVYRRTLLRDAGQCALPAEELAELNRLLAYHDQLNFGGEQDDYLDAAAALGMWFSKHREAFAGARADTYPPVVYLRNYAGTTKGT